MAGTTTKKSTKAPVSTTAWDMEKAAFFAKMQQLQLRQIGKTVTKSYTQFTKEEYRNYIENPSNNEKNLREMSRFFYRVSTPYWRLIKYYSELFLFYWTITPQLDFTGTVNSNKVLKDYYKVLQFLTNMNLSHEMLKVLTTVFKDGICYGFVYNTNDSFYIDILDPEYCQIAGVDDGVLTFAFNFKYYDSHAILLETIDKTLLSQYNKYKNGSAEQWQLIDPQHSICIKANEENPLEILPPLIGIFEDLIDLIDYKSLIRNREEILNYKMIIQKIPHRNNSGKVDDFEIDMDTAEAFYAQMQAIVPESVGVGLSPMDIEVVEFERDDTESDILAKAMRTIFDDSGTSAMLFNSDKSGKVGLDSSIRTDESMVFALVRQIERWVRRYLKYEFKQKYDFRFLDVTVFNRDSVIDRELRLAQASLPNKLTVMCAAGVNPLTTLSSLIFENEILKLHERFMPLQTSYTQSASPTGDTDPIKGGRPKSSDDDLDDGGVTTRETGNNVDTIETQEVDNEIYHYSR